MFGGIFRQKKYYKYFMRKYTLEKDINLKLLNNINGAQKA